MIAVDTNLLVYAHRADSEWHDLAFKAIKELAEGRRPWAIPWPCLHEFLAIVTHPKIYAPPTTLAEVATQINAWLEVPMLVMLAESDEHWGTLSRVLTASRVTGPRIHDARIAALCLQHGVTELWSADRDFSRFPELKVRNPLLRP